MSGPNQNHPMLTVDSMQREGDANRIIHKNNKI